MDPTPSCRLGDDSTHAHGRVASGWLNIDYKHAGTPYGIPYSGHTVGKCLLRSSWCFRFRLEDDVQRASRGDRVYGKGALSDCDDGGSPPRYQRGPSVVAPQTRGQREREAEAEGVYSVGKLAWLVDLGPGDGRWVRT